MERLQDFSAKERELAQKHKQEIETLNSTHSKELSKLENRALEKIDQIRQDTSDRLTESDRRHQQEIQNLKAFYQKKLEDQARSSKS